MLVLLLGYHVVPVELAVDEFLRRRLFQQDVFLSVVSVPTRIDNEAFFYGRFRINWPFVGDIQFFLNYMLVSLDIQAFSTALLNKPFHYSF